MEYNSTPTSCEAIFSPFSANPNHDQLREISTYFTDQKENLHAANLKEVNQVKELRERAAQAREILENLRETANCTFQEVDQVSVSIGDYLQELNKKLKQDNGDLEEAMHSRNQEMSDEMGEVQRLRTLHEKSAMKSHNAELAVTISEAATVAREYEQLMQELDMRINAAEQKAAEAVALRQEILRQEEQKRLLAEEEARIRRLEEEAERVRIQQMEEERRKEKLLEMDEHRRRVKELMARAGDPKDWPVNTYNVESEEFDHSVGCVIRAPNFGMENPASIQCKAVTFSPDLPALHPTEELVSNVIKLTVPKEHHCKLNFEIPWYFAMPHGASRNASKETVIKCLPTLESESWQEYLGAEVAFDEHKDLGKFMECRLPCLSLESLFLIVSKAKTDRFELSKRGSRFYSSVDSRAYVVLPPGGLKVSIEAALQVQVVEASFLAELKNKFPTEMSHVITSSHIYSLGEASTLSSWREQAAI